MKHITFYLDFISPYAWLAFQKLPESLRGLSYRVSFKPVLLGALLRHHGQLGPAEIPAKRDWTYRHVLWLARRDGVELAMPATHPFNPLGLLRLALACDTHGEPNRFQCETLFRHVWCGGAEAADSQRLQALTEQLSPRRDPADAAVKAQLKTNTDEAIAAGVFGVPAYEVDGKLFWGYDALPMLSDYLRADAGFDAEEWDAIAGVRSGIQR